MINNICITNRDHKYAAKLHFTQNKISEYKININKCLSDNQWSTMGLDMGYRLIIIRTVRSYSNILYAETLSDTDNDNSLLEAKILNKEWLLTF